VPAAAVIHGDLPQSHRERIMAAFRTGDIKYLIATDVMSRGIDVSDLSHVINFDLPLDIESYVHRIGRTGRIGRDGIAISFATPEQGGLLTDIEMMINKLIDHDNIPGREWYTPRRVEPRTEPKRLETAEQVASVRADSGWGIDEEDLSGGKLGVAEGEQPPAVEREDQPQAPTVKKPVFGKPNRRYSGRL
jgi:ATP-dependent RNA helicase DeaD